MTPPSPADLREMADRVEWIADLLHDEQWLTSAQDLRPVASLLRALAEDQERRAHAIHPDDCRCDNCIIRLSL